MAYSKELSPWYRADVTFREIANPSNTKTVSFVNRTARGGSSTYWPLLTGQSGIGQEIGQDGMPAAASGSITLDSSPHSFGFNRRIVDLLERYTVVDQPITLYYSQLGDDQEVVPSSWTLYWAGRIDCPEFSGDTLTLSVSTVSVSTNTFGRVLDETMATSGYSVPDNSLGKSLPIPIDYDTTMDDSGNLGVMLPAYCLQDQSPNTDYTYFAFSSGFGTQFNLLSGSSVYNRIYARSDSGEYVLARNFLNTSLTTYSGVGSSGAVTSHEKTEFVVSEWHDNGLSYASKTANKAIFVGARWRCKGQSALITPTGDIVFTLYSRPIGEPTGWKQKTTATVAKSYYLGSVRGAGQFWVEVLFDVPYVPDDSEEVGIGIVLTDYAGASLDFTSADNSTTANYQTRVTDGGNFVTVNAKTPLVELFVASSFVSLGASTDSSGFSFNKVQVGPPYTTNTGLALTGGPCDLSKLDLIVNTLGIADDSSGTITGVPNSQISRPDHVLKLATMTYSGGSWSASSDYDFTTYSSQYSGFSSGLYPRKVSGFLEGTNTVETFVSTLANEMACQLIPLNSGKLALLPWGSRLGVQKVFTDEDCNVLSFRTLDKSALVNYMTLAYGKNYLNVDSKWIVEGVAANNSGIITASSSSALYGVRSAETRTAQLMGDAASATSYCSWVLAKNNAPPFLIKLGTSFSDNATLEIGHIVDVLSVKLPAFGGTNHNAKLPTYQGTTNDLWKGRRVVRAQRYRCQIIGKNIDRTNEEAPTLSLDLRVIKPTHPSDPTADDIQLLGT